MSAPFTVRDDGVRLAVRVTPRAKKTGLAGLHAGPDGQICVGIRLAAPPVEGAANKALIAFVAAKMGLPRSSIRIRSGDNSRMKILLLDGDIPTTVDRLSRWIDEGLRPRGRLP